MIVGADGLHSVARRAVLDVEVCQPAKTDKSGFRLFVPTAKAEEDGLEKLSAWKGKTVTIV